MKEIFEEAVEETGWCLEMSGILVGAVAPRIKDWPDRENFLCASHIVDHLVRKGLTDREAAASVGAFVKEADGDMRTFINLCAENFDLKRERISEMLKPVHAIASRGQRKSDPVGLTKRSFAKARKCIVENEKFINHLIEETPHDQRT